MAPSPAQGRRQRSRTKTEPPRLFSLFSISAQVTAPNPPRRSPSPGPSRIRCCCRACLRLTILAALRQLERDQPDIARAILGILERDLKAIAHKPLAPACLTFGTPWSNGHDWRARGARRGALSAMSAENLPALIDRATRCLAEARTSAEVLEAKAIAEAALHFAKVTRAANDTQANCLRMIVRAEIRMADEIDRGQALGEVALPNQPVSQYVQPADVPKPATYEDLGVARQRVADWRAVRDAGPAFVERVITRALAEDRAPTKADIHRAINGTHTLRVMGSSASDEWYTPPHIFELAVAMLGGIDTDPCWHPDSPSRRRPPTPSTMTAWRIPGRGASGSTRHTAAPLVSGSVGWSTSTTRAA